MGTNALSRTYFLLGKKASRSLFGSGVDGVSEPDGFPPLSAMVVPAAWLVAGSARSPGFPHGFGDCLVRSRIGRGGEPPISAGASAEIRRSLRDHLRLGGLSRPYFTHLSINGRPGTP